MDTKSTLIEQYMASNNFGKFIGMDFKIISEGVVNYYLQIDKHHLATPNAAHGGSISALIDGALGVAALSAVCSDNKIVSTIEFKVNFISPAYLGDQLLAVARVEQKGKRIVISSCDVVCKNRENKLIAKALGTFNVYDAVKAGYVNDTF